MQDTAIPEDETTDGGDLTLSNVQDTADSSEDGEVQDTADSSEDGETVGGDLTLANVQDTAVSSEDAEKIAHSQAECKVIDGKSKWQKGLGCVKKAFYASWCSCKNGKHYESSAGYKNGGCVNNRHPAGSKAPPAYGSALLEM